MRRLLLPFLVLGFTAALAACGGTVTRPDVVGGASGYHYDGARFQSISVEMTPEAKKLLSDNIKFSPDALRSVVQRTFEARGLMGPDATRKIAISVRDIRVRSTFGAVFWGVLAGEDRLVGDVSVRDATGTPLHSFETESSYAWGGIAGGDETRMNYLYEKFATLAADEVSSTSSGQ